MKSLLKNRKFRAWAAQAAVLGLAIGLTVSFVLVARQNLAAQGIATGFGFLEHSTGWPIDFALIEVGSRAAYWKMLLAGLLNTLVVGLLGLVLATLVGLFIGLIRISNNLILNIIGTFYVEIFRNVPIILQAFFWYAVLTHLPHPRDAVSIADIVFVSNRGLLLPALDMSATDILAFAAGACALIFGVRRLRKAEIVTASAGWSLAACALVAWFGLLLFTGREAGSALVDLPELKGLGFVGGFALKPEFAALLFAITVFGGAYIGEIVRGGFLSVEKGRIEAALALGLSRFKVNRFVRIPLAVRAMLPALANQYVWLMKATTVGIAIGFPDYFMVVSTTINQTGQAIEPLVLLMGGFLLINYSIGFLMNLLNSRLAIKGKGS